MRQHYQTPLGRWVLLGALGVLVFAGGCSRQHFRERADRDVEALISQKNVIPKWQVENWHTYPDPRSRFADPSNPDAPPFPPDDYAARMLSPNPQRPGKGGVGRFEGDGYLQQIIAWDAQNRAENPDDATFSLPAPTPPEAGTMMPPPAITPEDAAFKAALTSTDSAYRLKLEQTVDLALFNSREFQDRREDLYLAALPVSLERFNFSAQWFATETLVRESAGLDRTEGGGQRWRIGLDSNVNRRFATGAELVVRLANQIVVDVRDGNPTVGFSTLGLSFVQPLLRGAGYAVTLEALTQAERTLLYAIRSYARFRSVFYNSIYIGGDNTNNPYGLQGLAANLGRGVGANLTARPTGYLPTVVRAATLANEQKNVGQIEAFLKRFQNLEEGGVIAKLQVGRVEQQLLSGRATVLQRQKDYADFLDNFKLQLGVPATLGIELDDTPLRPIRKQLQRFEAIYKQLEELEKVAEAYDPQEAPEKYRERWVKLLTESPLAKGTKLGQEYATVAAALQKQTEEQLQKRVVELSREREKYLDAKAERQKSRLPDLPEHLAAVNAIDAELDRIRFERALRRYESKPWMKLPVELRVGEQAAVFRSTLNAGILVALQIRAQRIEAIRAEWPNLPSLVVEDVDLLAAPLDQAYGKVAETALNNRYDLMNSRAQVVDSWRRITVVANSLQSVFDIGYDLDVTTPPGANAPASFSGSRMLHRIRLRLEPPFVRRAERNQYRTQLISYQRQRRSLQSFEDNIVTDARTDLRTVRQLAQAYQVQLRAVELAYSQVENARSTFLAPPDPRVQDTASSSAALTQQLLEAQGRLVDAQNLLYNVWANYLIARNELLLDMELLTLDPRGQWNDDAATTAPAPQPRIPGSPPGTQPERLPAPAADPLPVIRLPDLGQ